MDPEESAVFFTVHLCVRVMNTQRHTDRQRHTDHAAWTFVAFVGWLRGTVVERRSLTGELFLSYARPATDG